MKRYPAYKDSGVEWLGEVPEGWEVTSFRYIATEIQTGPFGSQLHAEDYVEDGIPLVNPSNIVDGQVAPDTKNCVDQATFLRLQSYALHPGDIVLARRGELGRCAVISADSETLLCGTGSLLVRPKTDRALPSFIAEYVRTPKVRDWLSLQSVGSTMENLNASIVGAIRIALPPLREQKAIAGFLDREVGKIDALVQEQRRLIALLAEKRQAVISHAVTRGLNPATPLKSSGIDWLGDIPEGWEVVPLRRVLGSITSGTSVNAIDYPAGLGELGVLKTSCVYSGHFDPSENKAVVPAEYDRVSCPVVGGTLIVSRMNTPDLVGAAGYVAESSESIFLPDRLWQVNFLGATAEFMHFWTLTNFYRDQVRLVCSGTSSSMQNLSQDDFKSFILAVPSLDEQLATINHLRTELPRFDALTTAATAAIALLQERRAALISAAVTGKIDLRDISSQSLSEPEHA